MGWIRWPDVPGWIVITVIAVVVFGWWRGWFNEPDEDDW
jgi:hypothetical protein